MTRDFSDTVKRAVPRVRDLIEETVAQRGRSRSYRQWLRGELRDEFAAQLAEEEAWRPPKRDRPCCGAKTRAGHPCKRKHVGRGGRCPNHGGMSTGPRTPEGRQRIADAQRKRWSRARIVDVEAR